MPTLAVYVDKETSDLLSGLARVNLCSPTVQAAKILANSVRMGRLTSFTVEQREDDEKSSLPSVPGAGAVPNSVELELYKCKSCSASFANSLPVCPQCGAPQVEGNG